MENLTHLYWAFDEGRTVRTPGGEGTTWRRRLAKLVLPTGRIAIGMPANPLTNHPVMVQPEVSPGKYPVFASIARGLAFLLVAFRDERPVTWEMFGRFFTESADGVIYDAALTLDLEERNKYDSANNWEAWQAVKDGLLDDGDCSLLLDETTNANAIVFRIHNGTYNCYLGKDAMGEPVCLVIDGTMKSSSAVDRLTTQLRHVFGSNWVTRTGTSEPKPL